MNIFERIACNWEELLRQDNPEYYHKKDIAEERYHRWVRWIMLPSMTIGLFFSIGIFLESWIDGDLKKTLFGLFVTAFIIFMLIYLRVLRKRRLKRLAEWESAQKEDNDREENNTPPNEVM